VVTRPGGKTDGARPAAIPDGARTTPVPDMLFSHWLPDTSDPVEIKVLLHVVWRVHRRKSGAPAALRAGDLGADRTLRRGVAALGTDDVDAAIARAVERLCAGELLVMLRVAGADGPEAWIAVNDRAGRSLFARLAAGDRLLPDLPPAAGPPSAPPLEGAAPAVGAVFELYERNIGLITPLLAEEIGDAAATYPEAWIADAIRLAVAANARRWSYVRAILERWARDGRDEGSGHARNRRRDSTSRRRDSEGPYAAFVEH
jgi:DnaD/phage-associated family protein